MSESSLADNRSKLKEVIASIATIRGDLSNITAPPFVLDTKSVVELPAFWAERPSVFVAPAASDNPAERALLVLKWFVSALRNQQYAGRTEEEGVKKPLNAFLGELFIARWEDESGTTRLVFGFDVPKATIRLSPLAVFGMMNMGSRHKETYLIPLPNVKIKGILTGGPYPELQGAYKIPSTSGYTSSIDFEGKGFFGSSSNKHKFDAKVYRDGEADNPLYTISGNWDSTFIIRDVGNAQDIETFDVSTAPTTQITTDPLSEQDPWESRSAWCDVREALKGGNMQAAADAKSKLENGQRQMRRYDGDGKDWDRLFYRADNIDEVAEQLARGIGQSINPNETVSAWKFRIDDWNEGKFRRPYRGHILPDNSHGEEQRQSSVDERTTQTNGQLAETVQGSVAQRGVNVNDTGPVIRDPREAPTQGSSLAPQEAANEIEGMTAQEKSQVEDFLRERHSSSAYS